MASSNTWQRAQEIFDAAVDLPPAERGRFVADACNDDAALRAEVESLLRHNEQATEGFLEPPPAITMQSQPEVAAGPDPPLGCQVGAFVIERVIDAGGMGTVYQATQDQPRRTVALKMMNRCHPSHAALRRFQFESQVLARLRHPHIAQVYAAGMHDDGHRRTPYFALEYVPEARSITAYAEDRQLDTRARLELFAKVCDAVHHGHQKGIIHRDLKPGNILVDPAGEPKVIDFGVARATDADVAMTSQQTLTGQIIGTMQYMSPEQCDADPHDIDTRTDVYSLGVVLYELLAGVPPYDATGTTVFRAVQIIREAEPKRLSAAAEARGSLARQLRGSVESIVLKSLQKDREKRYQSAGDLAQDIRRYLRGEPVEARPTTAWILAWRWVARHPVAVTAATCIALALTTALATGAAVYWLSLRPHRIVRSPDHSEARLLARNDNRLREWDGGVAQSVRFADLLNRPRALGGRRLAVLGFCPQARSRFPAALCAYDADARSEQPLWTADIEADQIPALLLEHSYGPRDFGVHLGQVADVFDDPNLPGPELLVIHRLSVYTHSALCVYDLAGQLRYQVWIDAQIDSMYWADRAGALVLAGMNGEGPWEDRGHLGAEHNDPPIVFAVRPRLGFITRDYVPQEQDAQKAAGEQLRPLWYHCVLPPDTAAAPFAGAALAVPTRAHLNDGDHVSLEVYLRSAYPPAGQGPGVSISWVLNATTGQPVGQPRLSDAYKRNQKLPDGHPDKLPAVDWHLGPLPPVLPQRNS